MTTLTFAAFDPTSALSAKEAAAFALVAKTAADRKAIRAYVEARISRNPRWQHLLADLDAGATAKIAARATGDWAAVNAERKATRKAKPAKAPAKAPAKPAKAKPAKPAAKQPAGDPLTDVVRKAREAGYTPEEAAAFAAAFLKLA